MRGGRGEGVWRGCGEGLMGEDEKRVCGEDVERG